MDRKEFITIAEYAKLKGISKQAVYQALNGKLKNFCTTVELDGKPQKVLYTSVLSISELERFNNQLKERIFDHSINDGQANSTPPEPPQAATVAELERLRQENAELKQTIKTKDSQIAEFALKFAELASQAQQITSQVNYLQLEQPKRDLPQAEERPINIETSAPPQEVEPPTTESQEPIKQGFFKRLFSRGK